MLSILQIMLYTESILFFRRLLWADTISVDYLNSDFKIFHLTDQISTELNFITTNSTKSRFYFR